MFLTKTQMQTLAGSYHYGHHAKIIRDAKTISMLHEQTLSVLWQLAHAARGTILELGPYVGGSTAVIADAIQPGGRRLITVEMGGGYEAHPHLPSKDIIADLEGNLARFGVRDAVTIVKGMNYAPETVEAVAGHLKGEKVGLLFIDSDFEFERYFSLYTPFLNNGSFLVFDDFESEGAPEKAALVKPFVERGIRDGFLHDLGVYPWGTWVGQFRL